MARSAIAFQNQSELEELYSKYQLVPCIRQEFLNAGFPDLLASLEIDPKLGVEILVQMVLHKRTTISIIAGIMRSQTPDLQHISDTIHALCEKDLLDWDPLSEKLILRYDISADVQERLNQFQYPLPMIHEPNRVSNNRDTGYDTIKGSLILKKNHHDEDICLDHINRANAVPLSVNTDVVAFVQNQWKNLDKPKPDEAYEDYEKRRMAFQKYDRSSRAVIEALLVHGNRFWLTHRYDKRGRSYAQGYHITYQGNDWNKACIQFAEKEVVK